MNVSLPSGKSLNDYTDPNSLEKVNMTSAKKIGYSILSAGNNATMLKFDKPNAYKNVPAKTTNLALQGFMWGGKFFVETRQMFGAKASVQNFDVLGNTVRSLVLAECRILRHLVHRQLDDTPVVAPASSGWCEEFSLKYRKLCSKLNLELAKPCPNFDKAFDCTKFGKVLGIWFDTRNQTWTMPTDKILSTTRSITEAYESDTVSLLMMQCLMVKLNTFAQMCPFMNCFKHPRIRTWQNAFERVVPNCQCNRKLICVCGSVS